MKKRKLLSLILVLILMGTVIIGCEAKGKEELGADPVGEVGEELIEDEYGIIAEDDIVKFVDARDEEIIIEGKPERVVVLFGSFVDIWMRNGGELVGMVEPSNEDILPGTEGIETVGKQGSISLEKVISLEPDLVILSSNTKSQMDLIPSLEENNIQVIALDYQLKEDYFRIAKIFATMNDNLELYEQDAKMVKEKTQEVIDKSPKDKDVKVLVILASKNSLGARTSETTIGEMFKDLHAINIADSSNEALSSSNFSLEKIIEEDPDFIFVQTMGSDVVAIEERLKLDAESNPAWASLSAVKNNRYLVLEKDLYTYKANHRYAEAYEGLARILYPEVFKE